MHFEPLPRRRFLQACVAAGAAASLLPAMAARAAIATHDTALGRLLVLDARRLAILEAFAEGTIATGDGFPPIRATGMARRIDEELFFVEDAIRDDLLLAIDAIDLLPIAYGRFSRLHRLEPADCRDFLASLADTRFDLVRALVNGLHMVTSLMYYADRAVWPAMGYDGTHAQLPPRDDEQRAHYRKLTGAKA